jgi:hypothetical protein
MDWDGGNMIYNEKQYDPINEKIINEKTYSAYRCSTNPKSCIIVCGDKIIETQNIKNIWPNTLKISELFSELEV